MYRQGVQYVMRVALALGLLVLVTIPCFPKWEMASTMGRFLVGEGVFFMEEGQEKRIVAELCGGQPYISWPADSQFLQEKMILEENHELYEMTKENQTPLIGDVEEPGQSRPASQPIVRRKNALVEELKESLDEKYLWKNFYIVDSTTSVTKKSFPVKKLLEMDMRMRKQSGKKQILIYHTHGASEGFKDSKSDKIEDSVVGVGDELTKELEKRGYGVYHDRTQYDRVNGGINRSFAYNQSLDGMAKVLGDNREIQVAIDLHRDSVGKGKHTYTMIQGKKTAIVMFFNGMSRTKSGPIKYLKNENLTGNLAFSLQLKCKAMEYYDGFTKPIYLKGYRYNLHLLPRSLLIELGNENNTVAEAKNAAAPLADVLDKVLSGNG